MQTLIYVISMEFCCADVPPGEESLAVRSEERRLFSHVCFPAPWNKSACRKPLIYVKDHFSFSLKICRSLRFPFPHSPQLNPLSPLKIQWITLIIFWTLLTYSKRIRTIHPCNFAAWLYPGQWLSPDRPLLSVGVLQKHQPHDASCYGGRRNEADRPVAFQINAPRGSPSA